MKTINGSSILPRNHLLGIAAGTALMLTIPLVAMQFSNDVNWALNDFVVAGVLLFALGFTGDLIARRVHGKWRKVIAFGLLGVVFLYVWAELAVGVFTNLGS